MNSLEPRTNNLERKEMDQPLCALKAIDEDLALVSDEIMSLLQEVRS